MAGNKAGAAKAAETNKLRHGPDFYKSIGGQSWKNPERSRKTGFALLKKETHLELSKKGGQKTKEDYKSKDQKTKIDPVTEVNQINTSTGE